MKKTHMPASISLVIPTYNRADLVPETIEAALAQQRAFHEIIVVDDGSTDDTPEVLAPYDGRIRIIRTANGGVQAARNRGVEAATGDFVTFCDSDDLLEPDFVEKVGDWVSAHPHCDAVYINFRKFNQTTIDQDDFSQAPATFFEGAKSAADFVFDIPDLYLRLFTVHPFYITGCTVRKTFFQTIGGFDTRFKGVGAEDGEFTLRAASCGALAFCTLPLGKVRRHSGNDSSDAINVMLGSASILEYASANHMHATKYRLPLIHEAQRLRIDVADRIFAKGQFDAAKPLFQQKFQHPVGAKFYVKKLIVNLPEPIRSMAWKITQAHSPAQ